MRVAVTIALSAKERPTKGRSSPLGPQERAAIFYGTRMVWRIRKSRQDWARTR